MNPHKLSLIIVWVDSKFNLYMIFNLMSESEDQVGKYIFRIKPSITWMREVYYGVIFVEKEIMMKANRIYKIYFNYFFFWIID